MFPNTLTFLRATAPDAYGNPGNDWTTPTATIARGMFLHTAAFVPSDTDVQPNDRLVFAGATYHVDSVAHMGPGRDVVLAANLSRMPDGA
jgi:hypothetical protein